VCSSIITGGFPSLVRDFDIVEQEATVTLSVFVFGYGLGALLISPLTEIATLG
jgi:DHA1 family multidrug resistance protein-like MFS transporter